MLQTRIPSSPATPTVAAAVADAGPGTPVTRSTLVVTLDATPRTEGPVALSLDVADLSGAPVAEATIIVSAASLEMRMETEVAVADAQAPGRYAATVDLAMAGRWWVTAQVTLPGGATTRFTYLVTLDP